MNTAIYSLSGASAGIGFAIPVDTLKSIVETIIRDGKVVRPLIGITYLDSSQARALGKEGEKEGGKEGGMYREDVNCIMLSPPPSMT